ncbi:cytochrome b [Pantoea dispersa]|uniref:cytochrome b n=1 Tax=Pantoea dispersa TaxID=59814 RepID=UPI0039B516AB
MKTRYSWQQITLHWISAVIIIWATLTGFYIALFNHASEHKDWVSFINVSLTTVYIPLFIVRLVYAYCHGKPNDGLLSHKEERLAALGHKMLYVNIALVLLTGVLMMERPINIFGLFSINQPLHDPALTLTFNRLHVFFCVSLALFIVGHILAVVKHQLAGKPLLRRMR